jgi:hypothetical protein
MYGIYDFFAELNTLVVPILCVWLDLVLILAVCRLLVVYLSIGLNLDLNQVWRQSYADVDNMWMWVSLAGEQLS